MPTFDYTPTFANAAGTAPPLDQAAAIIGKFILNHYDYKESILKPAIDRKLMNTRDELNNHDGTNNDGTNNDGRKIRAMIDTYAENISSAPTRDELINLVIALERRIHEHLFHNNSYFLPETPANRELLQEMMNSIWRILELTIEPTSNHVLRISLPYQSFSPHEQAKFKDIIKNYNTKAEAKPGSKRPIPLEPQYKLGTNVLTFQPPTTPKGASKGGKRKTHKRKTHKRKTQKRK
jgi:hypothetical protein